NYIEKMNKITFDLNQKGGGVMLKQGWSKFKRMCKSPKDSLRKALDFIFSEIIWDSIFKVFLKLLWAFKGMAKGLKRLIDSVFT
ncbi:TPA: hypothetical protein ACTZ5A_005538, partial [Bacillus cereus]